LRELTPGPTRQNQIDTVLNLIGSPEPEAREKVKLLGAPEFAQRRKGGKRYRVSKELSLRLCALRERSFSVEVLFVSLNQNSFFKP